MCVHYVYILKTIPTVVRTEYMIVLEKIYQKCNTITNFNLWVVQFFMGDTYPNTSCKLNSPQSCSLVLTHRVQAERLKMLNVKGENERKD